MKKIFLALLFFSKVAVSQNIKIHWSQESKIELSPYEMVKGNGNDFIKLCFEHSNKKITPVITRFENLSVVNEERFLVNQTGVRFEGFSNIKNNLYLFTNYYDKDNKTTSFYKQQLDIKTLKATGENQKLGTFSALKSSLQSETSFLISEDSSKVLMFTKSPYEKDESVKFHLGIYKSSMEKLWENTVTLPYATKFVDILNQNILNDGSVAVVIKHYDKETLKESIKVGGNDIPSYKIKVLHYSKDNSEPKEYVIDMGDKYLSSVYFSKEVGKDITLFGLYKNKSDGFLTGFVVLNLNSETKKISLVTASEFPKELISLVEKDKQGSDNEKSPGLSRAFKLANTVVRDNGDIDYLIQYDDIIYVRTSTSSYNLYQSGDIIDICIKKANNQVVITRVPKLQTQGISFYNGFKVLPYKDQLLLFYNDVESNLEQDLSKKPDAWGGTRKPNLVMAKIDGQGNLSRKILINYKDFKSAISLKTCVVMSRNKIALYASNYGWLTSSKDMVGTLEVEK